MEKEVSVTETVEQEHTETVYICDVCGLEVDDPDVLYRNPRVVLRTSDRTLEEQTDVFDRDEWNAYALPSRPVTYPSLFLDGSHDGLMHVHSACWDANALTPGDTDERDTGESAASENTPRLVRFYAGVGRVVSAPFRLTVLMYRADPFIVVVWVMWLVFVLLWLGSLIF